MYSRNSELPFSRKRRYHIRKLAGGVVEELQGGRIYVDSQSSGRHQQELTLMCIMVKAAPQRMKNA